MSEEKRRYRPRGASIVGPIILIALGAVFLLDNLGMLPGSAWMILLRLWPILIIAVGLDILLSRRSLWGTALALVIAVAIVGLVLWLITTGTMVGQAADTEELGITVGEATSAEIDVDPGVAALYLEALPEGSDYLVSGWVHLNVGEELERDVEVEGYLASLSLRSESGPMGVFGTWEQPYSWNLRLSPDIPLDLSVDVGVGEAELDLTGLVLRRLEVSQGMGRTVVTLPDEGRFTVEIDSGIGETVVLIPEGIEARIEFSTGISGRRAPAGYDCDNGICTSPGYAGADDRVELEISHAIGNVVVRQP
jgi:hypothetical protein